MSGSADQSGAEVPLERQAVQTITRFANALLAACGDEINRTEDRRRVFFTFIFGAINGFGLERKMSPPQIHAVALALFSRGFHMSVQESASLAQFCVNSTSRSSAWSSSIHEGMDEFFSWQQAPDAFCPSRILKVLRNAPRAS
jgi:hypothetical protein